MIPECQGLDVGDDSNNRARSPGVEIRVLQIVAAPCEVAGGGIGVNGPERRAASAIRLWEAEGIQVVVAYPRRGRLWALFADAGVPIVDFEIGSKFNLYAAKRLTAICKAHGVDVIHTQGPGSLDAIATLAGRWMNLPVVVTRPVMIEDEPYTSVGGFRRWACRRVDQYTQRHAARVVAVSADGGRRLMSQSGPPNERLRVIVNGINVAHFAPRQHSSADGSAAGQPVTLGMVAQLTSPKGWPDYMEVVSRLHREGLQIRARVVGDGPLRRRLERLAQELGIWAITDFRGYQEDVAADLGVIDVILFTSHREGLPVSLIEGMASGLPIVSTSLAGVPELVQDGINGFLVSPGDVAGLTARAGQLVRSPWLREAFGRASRSLAESRFSQATMIRSYAATYRSVAREASSQ